MNNINGNDDNVNGNGQFEFVVPTVIYLAETHLSNDNFYQNHFSKNIVQPHFEMPNQWNAFTQHIIWIVFTAKTKNENAKGLKQIYHEIGWSSYLSYCRSFSSNAHRNQINCFVSHRLGNTAFVCCFLNETDRDWVRAQETLRFSHGCVSKWAARVPLCSSIATCITLMNICSNK